MVSNSYKKLKNVWWIDLEYLFLRENNRTFLDTRCSPFWTLMRFNAIYTMPRKNYESPSTRYQMVEVESAFCGSSSEVTNPGPQSAGLDEQSVNTGFGGDFSGSEWDTDPTTK